MDPLSLIGLISGGIGAVKGIGQTAVGLSQLIGNKRPEEPQYTIPNEVMQMLKIAQSRASNPFPEGDRIRQEMGQTLAGAVQSTNDIAGDSGASLGAIASIYGKQLGSMNQLALTEYQAQQAAEKNLQSSLGTMADYKDRSWDFNVRQPYERALSEFYSKRSSGIANTFGGVDELVGAGTNLMQNDELIDSLSKLFTKKDARSAVDTQRIKDYTWNDNFDSYNNNSYA
jgi:hypothetical protein